MKKKKILVITPDTPDPSYIESIISPLAFLDEQYSIHPLDSLTIMNDVSLEDYYQLWQEKLIQLIPHYDAFFGFSFGGVILQQCFSLFTHLNKPMVLFSTPTCPDDALTEKLKQVIALCEENQIEQALHTLYQHVYYPNAIPAYSSDYVNPLLAAQRVIYGLTRVLQTDSTFILNHCEVSHVHLVGELSHLVNKKNVIAPKTGTLRIIPQAGMRMLRDNPLYCKKVIWEALSRENV